LAARSKCTTGWDAAHRSVEGLSEDDPESVARRAVFEQALQALGWIAGRNLWIDYRWNTNNDPADIQKLAAELTALADVILASGNVVIGPMLRAARTTPIVLVQVIDPVGSGFVESMVRPGGNVTGFTQFEYSLAGKWLELLKEIAPQVRREGSCPVGDPDRRFCGRSRAFGGAAAVDSGIPLHQSDKKTRKRATGLRFARNPVSCHDRPRRIER